MPREDLLWNFLWTWEATKDGRILVRIRGQKILIDQILIHEQLKISKEGTVDTANATFEESKSIFKWIIGPCVFVENEEWNAMNMKEEFHARFVAIL